MAGYIATSKTVEWGTPDNVFNPLNREFGFTVDVCARDGMQRVEKHFTPEMDGLKQNWDGEVCWMNPPYGRPMPKWIEKASKTKGTVVALLPAKTDTKYFELISKTAKEVRFIIGRVKFGNVGLPAPFGSMIVVWDGKEHKNVKYSTVKYKGE